MEQTIKERVKQYCISKGISFRTFEKNCGLSNGYFNLLKKSPSVEKMDNILSAFPDLNRDWLLRGEGPMLVTDQAEPSAPENMELTPIVPISAFAGGAVGDVPGLFVRDMERLPIVMTGQPWELAIRVHGDSMSPEIPDGAVLLISKVRRKWAIPYGSVAVLVTVDGVYVKEISEEPDGVCAHSLNPAYRDMHIPGDDIRDVYRVHMMIKNF